MNIFFVHQDPKIAAQMLANAHVRSQIKESVLMLAAAHHIFGDDKSEHVINTIELTHQHHRVLSGPGIATATISGS